MQFNQIKEWVKANKLLSAIIVGAIIIVIILYLGTAKQSPGAGEQPGKAIVETPGGEVAEAPTEGVTAPETASEEAPPVETVEETAKPTEGETA